MAARMNDYRVNLGIYDGPLDLLLYLIRRDEVDIHDIPIARITRQYIDYVNVLKQLDPNLAGEFLVFAATLMEIKTRMLLPSAPAEDGGQQGLEIDPRAELVHQLLEYKAFKDAAGDLHSAALAQSMKFPRATPKLPGRDEGSLDLEDVQIWDLLDAFTRLMESIGSAPASHEIIYDDTPLELHAADIVDRLQRDGPMTFLRIFEGRTTRVDLVGLFLALLELVRQKKVLAVQRRNFGEIRVCLNPNPPADEERQSQGEGGVESTAEATPGGGEGQGAAAEKPPEHERKEAERQASDAGWPHSESRTFAQETPPTRESQAQDAPDLGKYVSDRPGPPPEDADDDAGATP